MSVILLDLLMELQEIEDEDDIVDYTHY